MSNCVSSACNVVVLNTQGFSKVIKAKDVVIGDAIQTATGYAIVVKIKNCENVECYAISENIYFSINHFEEKFNCPIVTKNVIDFLDKDGNSIACSVVL